MLLTMSDSRGWWLIEQILPQVRWRNKPIAMCWVYVDVLPILFISMYACITLKSWVSASYAVTDPLTTSKWLPVNYNYMDIKFGVIARGNSDPVMVSGRSVVKIIKHLVQVCCSSFLNISIPHNVCVNCRIFNICSHVVFYCYNGIITSNLQLEFQYQRFNCNQKFVLLSKCSNC